MTEARALEIVEAALDLDAGAAREALLDTACGADAALRARVEAMLAFDRTEFRLLPTESLAAPVSGLDALPERIGPFRITRIIGQGGMGAVVRGERDDGVFDQAVAIKLIRRDLGDDRARERFAQERQILGRLRHPNIARILDGGEQDGRPWLAMDEIDGLPITHALAAENAGLARTLDAFEAVCEAVAHAHRNLVVHADIKPSNVLLDRDAAVRLLDFGIARLIVDLDADEVGDAYPLTRGYSAPERIAGMPPTIAGDIYALGVLLHEMLTAALPEEGRAASSNVRHDRIAAGDIGGDLDAIVAHALAPDAAARYPDVAALLGDVRAFRRHLPVAARGDRSWRYLAGKFMRRHRAGVIVTGATVLILAAIALAMTLLYLRAERERAEADARFMEVRSLARFMLFDLYDDLSDAPGTVDARAGLARTARAYLDRLAAVPDAPADLRLDIARGYRRLASVEGLSGVSSQGDPLRAARTLDLADRQLDAILAGAPEDAGALEEKGWVSAARWSTLADNADSAKLNAQAAQWFARAAAHAPAAAGPRLGTILTEKSKGYDLIWSDKPAEAIPVLRNAIAALRARAWPAELRRDARALEINLLNRLGDAIYYAGDEAASLKPYREAEAIVLAELARRPSIVWTDKLGEARFNISGTLESLPGGDRAALEAARSGVAAIERALAFGPDANLEKRLLILYGQEALVLSELGQHAEAATVSGRSVALREARLKAAPTDPQRNRDLAVALPNHARVLAKAGQREAACAAARRAVSQWAAIKARGDLGGRDAKKDVPDAAAAEAQFCG